MPSLRLDAVGRVRSIPASIKRQHQFALDGAGHREVDAQVLRHVVTGSSPAASTGSSPPIELVTVIVVGRVRRFSRLASRSQVRHESAWLWPRRSSASDEHQRHLGVGHPLPRLPSEQDDVVVEPGPRGGRRTGQGETVQQPGRLDVDRGAVRDALGPGPSQHEHRQPVGQRGEPVRVRCLDPLGAGSPSARPGAARSPRA